MKNITNDEDHYFSGLKLNYEEDKKTCFRAQNGIAPFTSLMDEIDELYGSK